MNDYKKLAVRYLMMNKRRSIITILAVIVATTILYAILNFGWSKVLEERNTLRAEQDYEIVFLTENQSQIEAIMADGKVKSASIAPYYDYNYSEQNTYENALYINTTNPYRMDKIQEELEAKYGVEGKINDPLAWTYLQGSEGGGTAILILAVMLVSFIFAIFGVGVVRNSIQLSTLEQIKDYGNMRCIGATKRQLKAIIYLEGAILEVTGNLIGFLTGFIVSSLIGLQLKLEVGFHVIPMIPVLIAFLGDLYFAMEENCKVVTNMSPVSAIRGEFRIRKEKIKVRKKNIYGLLFGVEGDYAYKNIMRNPGRFYKTVWSIGLAVAAFISVSSAVSTFDVYKGEMEEQYQYYHVFYGRPRKVSETSDAVMNQLPSVGFFEAIGNMEGITDVKRMYAAEVALIDRQGFYDKFTKEYLEKTEMGKSQVRRMERAQREENYDEWESSFVLDCYGYDNADMMRYQDMLVEGTLDVSENGIILVNGGSVMEIWDEDEYAMPDNIYVTFTDYKVGDTIDILDMGRLQELMRDELRVLEAEYEEEQRKLEEMEARGEDAFTLEQSLYSDYYQQRNDVYEKYRKQLVEEGAYKTYTIEGIVKDEVNHLLYEQPRLILPLEQYYEITGTDESMISGMQYHFDEFSYAEYEAIMGQSMEEVMISGVYTGSGYVEFMYMLDNYKKFIIGVGLAILFVVVMCAINIINTTASNLHLRRKELAQLRVIGVSKKRLMKMVMLEGVISSFAANVVGIIFGSAISYFTCELLLGVLFGVDYAFPLGAAVIGVIASVLILCGSVYVPLHELKQDIAGDLALGGE